MEELLKMEDQKLIDKVVEDFKRAEDARKSYETKWENNYRLYRSKIKKERKGKANLFIPYTFTIVEQLKARTQQALFQKLPYVGFAGVEMTDVKGAKIMESLVGFQMDTKINLPHRFNLGSNGIFIYGTAIALYSWKYEEKTIKRKQPVIDPLTGIVLGEDLVDEDIVAYDDPDIEFIPIDEFYPDPEGWDMKSCGYVCTRRFVDLKYLKAKEKRKNGDQEEGIYTLPAEDLIKEESTGDIPTNWRLNINGQTEISGMDRKKKFELISYYTDDEIIVILNRKYVIRKDDNDLYSKEKPFKRIVAIEAEKEFWGIPIVEVLADLQEELNTTRNQRIDNVSLVLNKVFKKRRNADVDNLEMKAGNVIEMDDIHADVDVIDIPDITRSAYEEEQIIKQDMQYVSGVTEYSRGATPPRKETATTVTTIQEAANLIFNYTIGVIERTGLLALGDAIKKLNQQYIDKQKVIRLLGEEGYEYQPVDPESIAGSYDVISMSPKLEAEVNKSIKRNQLMEMMNNFTNNPLTVKYLNIPEMMKKIMETYDIKDYTKLLYSIEQVSQAQQGQQQLIPGNPATELPPGVVPGLPGQDLPAGQEILTEMGEDNGFE